MRNLLVTNSSPVRLLLTGYLFGMLTALHRISSWQRESSDPESKDLFSKGLSLVLLICYDHIADKSNLWKEGFMFHLILKVHPFIMGMHTREAWHQDCEATVFLASTVRKQKDMKDTALLDSFIAFNLEPHSMKDGIQIPCGSSLLTITFPETTTQT